MKHQQLTDENLSVYYSVKNLDRWLSIRLETLGNIVVLSAAFASIFLTRAGKLKSGSAGWGLTQALSITGLLAWCVRVLTDLETQFMVSKIFHSNWCICLIYLIPFITSSECYEDP